MSRSPQKPLTKKKETTVKWTKDADNRLLKIEKQIEKIEKKLEYLIKTWSRKTPSEGSSTIVYSLKKKSWKNELSRLQEFQKQWTSD